MYLCIYIEIYKYMYPELGLRDKVVSQNRGPQYEPHYTIVLIIGTPKKVPLILGNPHVYIYIYIYIYMDMYGLGLRVNAENPA